MVFTTIRNVLALIVVAAVCTVAQEVKVNSYTYANSNLSGTVTLQNLAYAKVVNIIYANTAQTWGNTCAAGYTSGPDSSNKEIWSFNCAIGSAGISQFYVEYKVNGNTYYDNNGGYGKNYQVTPSTTPTPTTATPTSGTPTSSPVPAPAAGFQTDITTYLATALPSLKSFLLANISPKNVNGALAGSIIAATPGGANNYVFHWIRDAGLVMDVVNSLYKDGDSTLEQTFWDHASFTKRIQGLTTLTGLGEAKYYVTGTAFNDGWCRPQNDGPAVRASSFMRFSRAYLAKGGSLSKVIDLYNSTASGVIKADLEYVTRNYNDANGCDLWEEQRGIHFFTVAVQRRALYEGRDFANLVGDTGAATYYGQQAALLDAKLNTFWNSGSGAVQTTINGRLLDAAIPLGAIHGNVGDGLFAPQDDRVLASIFQLESGFINEYTLNQNVKVDGSGLPLSVAIGRYYGDTYDGANNSKGNPWYLTTLSVAETVFRAATAYVKAGSITVTTNNQKLFNGASPAGLGLSIATGTYAAGSTNFNAIIQGLQTYGDKHIRRVKYHGAANYHFNEQYNRDTGSAQGVNDLTWSYASLITTNYAREELKALTA
ncbi:Glycoside hydrolase family 15 carbohydrate-binding module family 21 protein, partial [Globisporangium splendens]